MCIIIPHHAFTLLNTVLQRAKVLDLRDRQKAAEVVHLGYSSRLYFAGDPNHLLT